MASPENLASMEPWNFRPTFTDSWFTEAIARDAEALTRALQKSLSEANTEALSSDTISQFLNFKPDTTPTPTVSSLSGSDQETAPKRSKNTIPGATGKVSKRKSRASKKSQTTFITADPANFRQMVQQVTGVRFSNSQIPMTPILKPEPQRLISRLPVGGGCLPTLDTSAFLLDHHHQQVVGPTSAAGAGTSGPGPFPFAPSIGVVDSGLGSGGLGGFDTFSSFPTLESWK
ncbi:hypothetical protein L6164_034266 [Bauhinia variegata]|uniref:Uncharacterized protein n=1 Tax=Bauhinia variegata TaxID=167791 RepID=A0ACB9KU65_BAUVA|nr:hypothetical protein L6164_034266 [Bauhinia variegata]